MSEKIKVEILDSKNTQGENTNLEVTEVIPEIVPQPKNTGKELAPLTANSLTYFDEAAQQEIKALANQIDVLEIENIMSYGSIPLLRSFEEAGKILQAESHSTADQLVMKQVIELSKQANDNYDEFNIVLKEPNLLQKILLKISSSRKDQHETDVKTKAVTSYKLLEHLAKSCEKWIDMLQEGFVQIQTSALQDKSSCEEIEKYIVAGRIAEQRIAQEVVEAKTQYDLSGLAADKERYDALSDGHDTLKVVLSNLEKSRAAYAISIGQLYLQSKTNKNVQIAVRSQKSHSMALAAQQLRNAVLDAKNRIALEGQKSIALLNSELMKKVSQNTALTAEESEKILLNGVYTVESALEAAKTVIEGCETIKKAREDRDAEVAQELGKLETLVNEISPFVTRLKNDMTPKQTT